MKCRFHFTCMHINKFFFRNDQKVAEAILGMKKCEELCHDLKTGGVMVNTIEDYLKGKQKQTDLKTKVIIENYCYRSKQSFQCPLNFVFRDLSFLICNFGSCISFTHIKKKKCLGFLHLFTCKTIILYEQTLCNDFAISTDVYGQK